MQSDTLTPQVHMMHAVPFCTGGKLCTVTFAAGIKECEDGRMKRIRRPRDLFVCSVPYFTLYTKSLCVLHSCLSGGCPECEGSPV